MTIPPWTSCSRRRLMQIAAGTAVASMTAPAFAEEPMRTGLGLVAFCCGIRRQWLRQQESELDLFEPLTFLKHAHQLGAGGVQVSLGVLPSERIQAIREFADEHDLFIEGIIQPPADTADVERFTNEVKTARELGVSAVRTVVMPGRRYERFHSLEEFRHFEALAHRTIERAAPIVARHNVTLAIENHKDQRTEERIRLLEHIDSEHVGACIDTGNSIALLEDPLDTVKQLAPWARSVHLKDQAVQEYSDGFLLGDIELGGGAIDLNKIVDIISDSQPQVRYSLELITRDPLKVPCLNEKYWTTMQECPAADLARTIRWVRAKQAQRLPSVHDLPLEEQVALEDAHISSSLKFARTGLKI